MVKFYYFSLPGITCINCVAPVLAALALQKNVLSEKIAVDISDKLIAIPIMEGEASPTIIIKQLQSLIEELGIECIASENPHKSFISHLEKGLLGTALGIALMILMMSGIALPMLVMYGLVAASSLLTIFLGADSYVDAFKKLYKTKTLTMDALFAVSTLTVIGVSIASFFFSWLPMMTEAGLMIFGFRHIGKFIEESLKQKVNLGLKFRSRAGLKIEKLTEDNPELLLKANKIRGQKFNDTPTQTILKNYPISALKPGDIIVVRKGKVVPVDCESLDEGFIYTTIVTGATLPCALTTGSKILAGMQAAEDGDLILRVVHSEADSHLAKLDEQILKANSEKAPIETATNKILHYFIPAVIGIALFSSIVVGMLCNPALAIQCAITLLVSACPCTLGFITPLSIKIGMTKAVESGIEFKSGKTLQTADKIDTVIFDLNGTLTTGVPTVSGHQIVLTEEYNSQYTATENFFSCLALIENESKHPIAKAICEYVKNKNYRHNTALILSDIDTTQHAGIIAKINDAQFIVGNREMMLEHSIDLGQLQSINQQVDEHHVIYLARENLILGYIILQDPIRENAKEAVLALKKMGKNIHMCTGADLKTAKYYASVLGIPERNIAANCVTDAPHENAQSKTHYIRTLQDQGKRVCMIGDAANDALAIAQSNFGMAIKSNSGDVITQQQAGAVINNASLLPVVTAFTIAKQTVRNIKENLLISLAYNSGMMLFAAGCVAIGFAINPGIGVALMILQTSVVLLNQYRFRQKPLCYLKDDTQTNKRKKTIDSSYRYLREAGLAPKNPEEFVNNKASQHNFSPISLSQDLLDRPFMRKVNDKDMQDKVNDIIYSSAASRSMT